MKIENVKVYKKLLALVLAGTAVFTLASCKKQSKIEDNVDSAFVIEMFSDTTCLDDLMSEQLFNDVKQLEDYLNYSEELHSLELEKDDITLESIKVEDVDNLDNYKEDVEKYKELLRIVKDRNALTNESIEFYVLNKKLGQYDELVNSWLGNVGYSVAEQYGILAIKSVAIEATGAVLDQVTINPNPYWNSDEPVENSVTINENNTQKTLFFDARSLENTIVNRIMQCQVNSDNSDSIIPEYNGTRNSILRDGILNNVKLTIPCSYVTKGDSIESVINEKGSRSLIENASNNVAKSNEMC